MMTGISATNGIRTPICDNPACGLNRPETFYVHLHDGCVDVITDVTRIEVTDQSILFERGDLPTVTYPRTAVYFTCCQRDQPPPQF